MLPFPRQIFPLFSFFLPFLWVVSYLDLSVLVSVQVAMFLPKPTQKQRDESKDCAVLGRPQIGTAPQSPVQNKCEIELNDCELQPNLNTVASTQTFPRSATTREASRPRFLSLPRSIPPQDHPCPKRPFPRNWRVGRKRSRAHFLKTSEISPSTVRFRPCACLTRTPGCTKHGDKTTQTWRSATFIPRFVSGSGWAHGVNCRRRLAQMGRSLR